MAEKKRKEEKMKKNDELLDNIIKEVQKKMPTKEALCKKFGITVQCLYNWLKDDQEFRNRYKVAEKVYLEKLAPIARNSIERLVKGYDYDEKRTIYGADSKGEPVILQQTITRKHVAPSVSACMYVLNNIDPENFE